MSETRARRVSTPDASGVWLDEGAVSPGWAPPGGDPARPPRVRRVLAYAGVPLALALVVAAVALAGGFERRTDRLAPAAPGALVVTGPYELSFTEATVRPREDSDGRRTEWELTVLGRARLTGEEAMSPTVYGSDSMFALKDPGSGRTYTPAGADLGDDPAGFTVRDREELTPGLPPIGYRVSFDLPPDFRPPPTVRLAVDELVYESTYLVSDEKAWDGTGFGWVLDLPVRVLPAERS